MTTRIERMAEVCERRKRETGDRCIEECMSIGWCNHVYAGVMAPGRVPAVREDTPARRYFLHKYLPFLIDLMNDPDKLEFCREHYGSTGEDKWNLRYRIYDELMPESYEVDLVPSDYVETYGTVKEIHGDVYGCRRLDKRSLNCLSDKQVISIVAMYIRCDYWDFGSLMRGSIPSGDLLYYLEELDRRWSLEG